MKQKNKPIESYIIPQRHSIKWPHFERNAFIIVMALILGITTFVLM